MTKANSQNHFGLDWIHKSFKLFLIGPVSNIVVELLWQNSSIRISTVILAPRFLPLKKCELKK